MVGVPGKYKGCNTCRRRRVKCDMAKPECKKCIDSERQCEGYKKDLTFIVGTPDQKGRCSSHPHRSILKANPKKAATPPKKRVPPINVTSAPQSWTSPSPPKEVEGVEAKTCVFVHTPSLRFDPQYESEEGHSFTLPYLASTLPFLHDMDAEHQLSVRGCAFVDDSTSRQANDGDVNPRPMKRHQRSSPTESHQHIESSSEPKTLYLFEATNNPDEDSTFAHIIGGTPEEVKRQGPSAFHDYPAHQFFARLWRPLTITHALQCSRKTFLTEHYWSLGPFEKVQKTPFDTLWDVVAQLPDICERGRRTIGTTDKANVIQQYRSMKATDLLQSCLNTKKAFEQWLHEFEGNDEENGGQRLYWLAQGHSGAGRRRSSPAGQGSPFPRYEFRDVETAHLLVTYWAALITFYKMVAELLVAAQPPIDSGASSQLAYRPSAGASPAYHSSSPQASISSASAASPSVSINASDYNGYGALAATTQGYGYDATPTTTTSFNPQYPPNIFLPSQHQQTPYLNFSTSTYPPHSAYAPVVTTTYTSPPTYAPDNNQQPTFQDPSNYQTYPVFDPSLALFPSPASPSYDFSSLYLNIDPASYMNQGGAQTGSSPNMDYLPPPQRNCTPSSYISAPGSHHSHHSPAGSFMSNISGEGGGGMGSVAGSHAATPPDMNSSSAANAYSSNQGSSPAAGSVGFNTVNGPFAALFQNSRVENLNYLAALLGAGLSFLVERREGMEEVVLLMWPLGVLEGMCSDFQKRHCEGIRSVLERRAEEVGRWVGGRRWRACGGEGEE